MKSSLHKSAESNTDETNHETNVSDSISHDRRSFVENLQNDILSKDDVDDVNLSNNNSSDSSTNAMDEKTCFERFVDSTYVHNPDIGKSNDREHIQESHNTNRDKKLVVEEEDDDDKFDFDVWCANNTLVKHPENAGGATGGGGNLKQLEEIMLREEAEENQQQRSDEEYWKFPTMCMKKTSENADEDRNLVKKKKGRSRRYAQCERCGFRCLSSTMSRHYRSHSDVVKPYQCHHCSRRFASKSNIAAHIVRTHVVGGLPKKYHCDVCGRGFTEARYLDGHRRVHTGEKPFRCDECGKRFRVKNSLTLHKRVEARRRALFAAAKKKYGCDLCGKTFDEKCYLKTHMNGVHFKLRKYPCRVCDKRFRYPSKLKRHSGLVHSVTQSRSFRCEICDKLFKDNATLKRHVVNLHFNKTGKRQRRESQQNPTDLDEQLLSFANYDTLLMEENEEIVQDMFLH